MITRHAALISAAVLLTGCAGWMPWGERRPAAAAPETPHYRTVAEFSALKEIDTNEPYGIEGYIVEAEKCPECPPGTTCTPCHVEYVVISDIPRRSSTDPQSLSRQEHRVYIQGWRARRLLKKWSRYQFEVRSVANSHSHYWRFPGVTGVEAVTWRES